MRKLTNMGGKTLFVMVLSSALLAAGCMEEGGAFGGAGSRERTLDLRMEAATKVSVDDASGVCSWTSGDAIAVRIYGTAPEENKYETPAVDASGGTVNVNLEGNQDIAYYSVFPASARVDDHYGGNGTDLRVKYAPSYALPSGLTGDALNKWSPLPMVAKNTAGSTSLDFYHAGGVLRIKMLNFPSATSCTVTLEGMTDITGTFKVENPGTATATTSLVAGTGSGDNNTVAFTGIPSIPAGQPLWINLPLPTGDYASLTSVKVEAGGKAVTKAVKWNGGISHAQGRRLSYDFNAQPGELATVNIGSEDPVTLWVGEPHQRTAMACDANGTFISGATISWESSDASVAEVDNGGNVTTKAAGSAVLTATATLGGVSKTAEYTVYVNEITDLSLSCGATTTLIIGKDKPVTATATYTMNGDPEVPEVNWVVAPSTLATLASDVTASGAANSISGLALGSGGTLTVSIPANRYGSNAALDATCSFNVLSSNYLPGAFSVSPTEKVYFSRGNLQVNYTNNGGTVTREWLFSENQWDIFCPTTIDELYSLPTPAEGTTVRISHFGWGTAGHENTGGPDNIGPYGYNTEHRYFEPHHMDPYRTSSPSRTYGVTYSTWTTLGLSTLAWDADNDWKRNDDLRKFLDWGIHFDDAGVGHDDKYDGTWFTLSMAQWKYLFVDRPGAIQKVAPARIVYNKQDASDGSYYGSIPGLVIFPDDWVCPDGLTVLFGKTTSGYASFSGLGFETNNFDMFTTWPLLEASGAVFLPAAGERGPNYAQQQNLYNVYSFLKFDQPYIVGSLTTDYWTSSLSSNENAYFCKSADGQILYMYNDEITKKQKASGLPVRLVHYANQ